MTDSTLKLVKFARFHQEKNEAHRAVRAAMTEADRAGAEAWLKGLAPEKAGSTEDFELNPTS